MNSFALALVLTGSKQGTTKWLIRGRRIAWCSSNQRHGHLFATVLLLLSWPQREKRTTQHRKAARAVFSVAWSHWELAAQWPMAAERKKRKRKEKEEV